MHSVRYLPPRVFAAAVMACISAWAVTSFNVSVRLCALETILPLHTTISSIDKSYIEAAQDLGADKATVFLKTTLPLSMSGIFSGITMVFIPTISTYAISQLLSNGKIFLFGDSIQLSFEQGMYGVGSIMSLVMLVFVLISNFVMNKFNRNSNAVRRSLW